MLTSGSFRRAEEVLRDQVAELKTALADALEYQRHEPTCTNQPCACGLELHRARARTLIERPSP